ncbi:IclR family transcriptional regulator [Rhodococcus sp. NPDC055024]
MPTSRILDELDSGTEQHKKSQQCAGLYTSVNRALALLNSFGPETRGLNLTQLAERTGLSKWTALRILNRLRRGGYVGRDGMVYVLGERLVTLASAVTSTSVSVRSDELREVAMPFLQDLYGQCGQMTVHLAVLDDLDVVYVEKLFGHRRVNSPSRLGGRIPAICTAVGKSTKPL